MSSSILNPPSVAVVVIGDIGRSPRMQYHAIEICNQTGYDVDLVGWSGTDPCAEIQKCSDKIRLRYLNNFHIPFFLNWLYFTRVIYKLINQVWMLFWTLMFVIPSPRFILVQTPPAIPLLVIAKIVCYFRNSKLVIDWHNYGYTWLAVNRPGAGYLVKMHKQYERFFGRMGDFHLCVSKAMREDLKENWNIKAHVLYDAPQPFFNRSDLDTMKALFQRYIESWSGFGKPVSVPSPQELKYMDDLREKQRQVYSAQKQNLTFQTSFTTSQGTLRADRPPLIVSSTSYTADEDFSLLLDALTMCETFVKMEIEKHANSSSRRKRNPDQATVQYPHRFLFPKNNDTFSFPSKIRFVVTGLGDRLPQFHKDISQRRYDIFEIFTVFLPFEDYAALLGSADLGISLHFSSSKLDLPMKVIDMFGSSLPVLAYRYPCLSRELVKDGFNGFTFETSAELAEQMFQLFKGFPLSLEGSHLQSMRNNLAHFNKTERNWRQEWQAAALPIFGKSENLNHKNQVKHRNIQNNVIPQHIQNDIHHHERQHRNQNLDAGMNHVPISPILAEGFHREIQRKETLHSPSNSPSSSSPSNANNNNNNNNVHKNRAIPGNNQGQKNNYGNQKKNDPGSPPNYRRKK